MHVLENHQHRPLVRVPFELPQGDGYLRRLLVVGATAVLRFARQNNASRAWAAKLLERKKPKLVAVALANKTARIAWAVLTRNQVYTAPSS